MDDLIDKIEQLRKSLLSLKQNQKKDAFVPAIKPQVGTIKPPALPKVPSKVPGKIPGGLPPPSKKDPVKVAEQLKNPQPGKAPMEVLKIEDNGQWSLDKEDKLAMAPTKLAATALQTASANATRLDRGVSGKKVMPTGAPLPKSVDAGTHGWQNVHAPHQSDLIHGLNLAHATPVNKGLNGAATAINAKNSKAIVKNSRNNPYAETLGHNKTGFNDAKREVLYHNMAHDFFGLGKHVPTTAGFSVNGDDWSAQEKIDKASPPMLHGAYGNQFINARHARVISQLNNAGTLDKMTLMDHLMGNHDRHGDNYLVDDAGDNLHLIDNGAAFDYDNRYVNRKPHYRTASESDLMGHDNRKLHPAAKEWLRNLSPEAAQQIMAKNGYDENHPATQGLLKRLGGLQASLHSGEFEKPKSTVDDILWRNAGFDESDKKRKQEAELALKGQG